MSLVMSWKIIILVCICTAVFTQTNLFGQSRLLINEIMANPSGGQLPQVEWVELYNPNDQAVSLRDYRFHYNQRIFPLPNLFLGAKQYAILCSQSVAPQLEPYGNVIALSTWPTLSNTGATLLLSHVQQGTVDSIPYSNRWYTTAQKRNGGWSLERINPDLICQISTNWQESNAFRGGTPGRRNSVFDSGYRPVLQVLSSHLKDSEISIVFNYPIDNVISINDVYIRLESGHVPLSVLEMVADTLKLVSEISLQPHIAYTVAVQGYYCGQSFELEHVLFESQGVAFNDVVINEVLFNPKLGGVDFVELYNRSDKTYNLQEWRIGNRVLSAVPWLLDPQAYVVVTTDDGIISQHYPSAVLDRCIVLPSLPAYANERGVVTIFDQTGVMVDSLYYTSSMHQPFVANPRGVSLERQSFDRETNEPNNFVSAATTSEGATPGYKNSRQETEKASSNKVFLRNKVISPDGDGRDDLLLIAYNISDENIMLNLHIYDDRGRLIKQVVRNQSVGFSGHFSWDGKAENATDCASGTYIVWAEVYNDKGLRKVFKEAFVLVRSIGN